MRGKELRVTHEMILTGIVKNGIERRRSYVVLCVKMEISVRENVLLRNAGSTKKKESEFKSHFTPLKI